MGHYLSARAPRLQVISLFDPWRGPLCTCPPKYSCSPYTSCSHACRYCYITSYIRRGFGAEPKRNFLARLRRDLNRVDIRLPISIANSSDPYTPEEAELQLTRRTLQLLIHRGFRILILTKSDLVIRDLDLIKKGGVAVSITITTLDPVLARRLEPRAPNPKQRLSAIRMLARAGIPVIARIDPIIPGVNEEGVEHLVRALAEAGVSHIVSSTYKAKPDNFVRVLEALPEHASRLLHLYREIGERVSRTLRYAPKQVRLDILKRVRDAVIENGMSFATCREGFPELNTAASCDGTHLIPPNPYRPKPLVE
ncbi:radical SAM protein [archaeon]|nr:radical SAM protein [archaeon]